LRKFCQNLLIKKARTLEKGRRGNEPWGGGGTNFQWRKTSPHILSRRGKLQKKEIGDQRLRTERGENRGVPFRGEELPNACAQKPLL